MPDSRILFFLVVLSLLCLSTAQEQKLFAENLQKDNSPAHQEDNDSLYLSRSLQKKDRLLILTEEKTEPFQDTVKDMAKEMGKGPIVIEVVPWARGYRMALHHPNILLFPTTRTPEREELFFWVGPLWSIQWILYGRKGTDVLPKTLEEAKKVKRIGTYRDDVREKYLKEKGFTNLDTSDNQLLNFRKLINGRVDLATASSISVHIASREIDVSSLEPVLVFNEVNLYLAFSRGTDQKIVSAWQQGYEAFAASGGIAKHCCPLHSCPRAFRKECR